MQYMQNLIDIRGYLPCLLEEAAFLFPKPSLHPETTPVAYSESKALDLEEFSDSTLRAAIWHVILRFPFPVFAGIWEFKALSYAEAIVRKKRNDVPNVVVPKTSENTPMPLNLRSSRVAAIRVVVRHVVLRSASTRKSDPKQYRNHLEEFHNTYNFGNSGVGEKVIFLSDANHQASIHPA